MAATDDYLESLYKELYKSELERSDKLDVQVNLPAAIVTGLLAVSGFYIEHFPRFEWKLGIVLFSVCLLVYGGFLLGSVYCLIRSYFRYQYQLLPPPQEIDENVAELRIHYEAQFDDGRVVDENVKSDIQRNIVEVYESSGSFNRQSNTKRIAWLYWSTGWIIGAIITLVISRGIYYFGGIAEVKPQEIKVTEMPSDTSFHRVKVELADPRTVQRVEFVNPPDVQKVEIIRTPDVQKVQILVPEKGGK
jgi:hypothetical protein